MVEDDGSMCELVREMLPSEFQIDEAAHPTTARAQIRANSYDLILMDINLQAAENGVDLLDHIRAETPPPDPLVVAMTAYAMERDAESFRDEGFDGYVPKPFTQDTLRKNLIQVMEGTSDGSRENGSSP